MTYINTSENIIRSTGRLQGVHFGKEHFRRKLILSKILPPGARKGDGEKGKFGGWIYRLYYKVLRECWESSLVWETLGIDIVIKDLLNNS